MIRRSTPTSAGLSSPDLQRNRHLSATRRMAVRKLKIYDPMGAERSRQELTERRGQLSAEYNLKFNQFIDAFIDPLTGQLRGRPDGDM